MSVKDVKEYYNQICDQYHEMVEDLREFENDAEKTMIEPERLDQMKEIIKPLMANYQTLSYIIFLLNQPVKKNKQARYQGQNKKLLKSIQQQYTKEGVMNANEETLVGMKKIMKGQ